MERWESLLVGCGLPLIPNYFIRSFELDTIEFVEKTNFVYSVEMLRIFFKEIIYRILFSF